jgi:NADPH:quinone reductase-like Zn-dependent oxidoreductase
MTTVVAGTGPAGGEGIDKVTRITYLDTARGLLTRQDPKQFLFFTRTPNGRRAGREFLARLEERTNDRDKAISVRSFRAQLTAIHRWGQQKPAASRASTSRCWSWTVTATRWCPPRTPLTSIDDSPTANSSSIPTPGTAACSSSTRTSSRGRSSSSERGTVMKAFVVEKYGKDGLRAAEVPEPEVGDGDVLVKVSAASVNPLDMMVRNGEFKQLLKYRPPFVLGHDVAGVVTRVGSDVGDFQVGDEVYARPRDLRIGTYAEYISIDQDDVAPKPASLSLHEAAAVPLVSLAAWQALVDRAHLKPGQKVLVHAGSGGLGSTVIQLAKHLGATVATTASGKNAELVRSLGADVVVDYKKENFADLLSGYDVVLDPLGGENLQKSLTVLKPGGQAISVTGPPDPGFAKQLEAPKFMGVVMGLLSRKVHKQARKLGVSYTFLFMQSNSAQLRELAALYDAGHLRPVIDTTFPFDQTLEALAYVEQGRGNGKVVITLD